MLACAAAMPTVNRRAILDVNLHATDAIARGEITDDLAARSFSFTAQTQRARNPRRRSTKRARSQTARRPSKRPDVIYYPTPPETVAEMLRLARVEPTDVLYDLGSGDGRLPIAAAKDYGIRAVGIEIDPKLVAESNESARQAGVANLVSFRTEDLFRADFREATIVTLYLSNALNVKLLPRLLQQLRPGARIVSHDFHMGDWKPEQTVRVPWRNNLYRTVYVWTVPPRGRRSRTLRR